jgi:hypothetical protein
LYIAIITVAITTITTIIPIADSEEPDRYHAGACALSIAFDS